ncbi:hypothetical protein AB0K40_45540 [Nonomuraea bangladeshensis]|uniref:Uncharacterized protein n=1 Tax=Nonomuraea bangladeshensis TaxID=404385 RepID=A0ABV3HJU0_9ACTN
MRYTLRLAEEWDGGLLACFEVGGEVLMVTLEAAVWYLKPPISASRKLSGRCRYHCSKRDVPGAHREGDSAAVLADIDALVETRLRHSARMMIETLCVR